MHGVLEQVVELALQRRAAGDSVGRSELQHALASDMRSFRTHELIALKFLINEPKSTIVLARARSPFRLREGRRADGQLRPFLLRRGDLLLAWC